MENLLRIMRVSSTTCRPTANRSSGSTSRKFPEKAEGENVLQIAVRTRIKLYYRPAALRGGDAFAGAQQPEVGRGGRRQWPGRRVESGQSTPYHVTFTGFRINKNQQEIRTEMLPPMAEQSYPLKAIKTPQAITVTYTTINDYGGETPWKW